MAKIAALRDHHCKLAMSDTVKATLLSATLHARILEAELTHLHDNGFKATSSKEPQELKEVLSSLLQRLSSQPETQLDPPASINDGREVLPIPLEYIVQKTCIGPDYQYLIAHPEDHVIVHAWVSGYAVAYNPRNKTAGRVPKSGLEGVAIEINTSDIALATESNIPTVVGELRWKVGDYIRICDWDDSFKCRGTAFNMRTLQIGRFTNQATSIKIVEKKSRRNDHDYQEKEMRI